MRDISREPASGQIRMRKGGGGEGVAKTTPEGRDKRVFTAAKDAVASQAARTYLNGLVARYGHVRELKIDSRAKAVAAVCELLGEAEPVVVRVESYRIVAEGDLRFVEITECSCSRPWLQNLLHDHVRGRRLKLPAWAAAAL